MASDCPEQSFAVWEMRASVKIFAAMAPNCCKQNRRAFMSAPAAFELWCYSRFTVPIPVIIPVMGPVMPAAVAEEDPTDSQAYTVPAAIMPATASFSSVLRIATAPFWPVHKQDITFRLARNRQVCQVLAAAKRVDRFPEHPLAAGVRRCRLSRLPYALIYTIDNNDMCWPSRPCIAARTIGAIG
jgi:hypothetical protein